MTLRELSHRLFQAGQHHNGAEPIFIYNNTGERIEIQYLDSVVEGELRLVVKENKNGH